MVMGEEGRWVRIWSCPVSYDLERVAGRRQGNARYGKERRRVYGFQVENKTYGILTFSLTCP